jgi:hypothetical protein
VALSRVTPRGRGKLYEIPRPPREARPQFGQQLVHCLDMTFGRRFRSRAEFFSSKIAQGLSVPRKIERLRAYPWPKHWLRSAGVSLRCTVAR